MDTFEMSGQINHSRSRFLDTAGALPIRVEGAGNDGHGG